MRPHIRFCLYIFVSTLPTYPFFHAFNNHFLQPTLPFCQQLFSTSFVNSFVFFLITCLATSTVTSAKLIFFSQPFPQPATISLGQQPSQPISFSYSTISLGFLAFTTPPPAIFLARLSISVVFTVKSWGEPCRGIELSISRIWIAHV